MKKLLPVIFALCANYAHAQVFSQNFNPSSKKRTYVGGGTNQFDWITDFKNSKSTIESESGNNFLRFDKIGASSILLSKSTPLNGNANNLAYVQFKFRVSAPAIAETPVNQLATFYLGNGDTDTFEPNNTAGITNDHLFAAIGLRVTKDDNGAYKFYISPVTQNTYSGWQNVTWAANRTGKTITFLAPDGKNYTLADNKQAIWVGDILQIGSGSLNGAQTTFSKFKLRFAADYPNLKIDLDDLTISSSVPTK